MNNQINNLSNQVNPMMTNIINAILAGVFMILFMFSSMTPWRYTSIVSVFDASLGMGVAQFLIYSLVIACAVLPFILRKGICANLNLLVIAICFFFEISFCYWWVWNVLWLLLAAAPWAVLSVFKANRGTLNL